MFPAHVRHCLAAFVADLSLSAAFTVVPFHIFYVLNGGANMSGQIMAVQALLYGLGCIGLASVIQHSPRAMTYAGLSCFVCGVGTCAMGLTKTVPVFTAVFMLAMTIHCFFWPAMQSWLGGERNPHLRARRISVYNLSWCLGLAIGPLFAGPLYDYGGSMAGFLFAGVTAIVAGALTLSLPQQMAPQGGADPAAVEADDREGETHLYATWLASFTGWLLVGVCRSVLPKRVDELVNAGALTFLGFDTTDLAIHAATSFSWIVFVLYATRAIMSLTMGRTVWWRYSWPSLAALQVSAAGAFWLMGYTSDLLLLAVAATLVGVNGAASFFASLEYSLSCIGKRGSRASIHEGMVGLGSALGSVTFGYLAGVYGTAWPFLYTPFLIVLSLVLQVLLLQRSRRRMAATV